MSYTIDLTHENSLAVEVLVWFLYFSIYPHLEESGKLEIFDGLRFSLHVSVNTLAKKVKVQPLALLAKKHFIKAVKKHWSMSIFLDCIHVLYGVQPGLDSTFRKVAVQKMKLSLEWGIERGDVWDDFQRNVQSFPWFACDVLAELYPKPILKPIAKPRPDFNGGSKEDGDVEPGKLILLASTLL